MIDRKARETLRLGLIDLATGVIHGDEFTELHLDLYWRHVDRGVKQLAWSAWTLYSDDCAERVKFDLLPSECQETLRRMDLFLLSDLEYEWPDHPKAEWLKEALAVVIAGLWFCAAISLWHQPTARWSCITFSAAFIFLTLILHVGALRRDARKQAAFEALGDHAVWPFKRRADHERWVARRAEITPSPPPAPPP